jgi:uncharacterized protein
MPETRAPIHVTGQPLETIAALVAGRTLPPVDKWNPTHCGNSEMRIARDGTWFHQGGPITRPAMVRLFSTVLRREPDGGHVLVTPVEKLSIEVEATAFIAIEMECEGTGENRRIALGLNSGDALVVGRDHPLTIHEDEHGPQPRVLVRHGLEATLARPLDYELAEIALAEAHDPPGVWSDGCFFLLGPTS